MEYHIPEFNIAEAHKMYGSQSRASSVAPLSSKFGFQCSLTNFSTFSLRAVNPDGPLVSVVVEVQNQKAACFPMVTLSPQQNISQATKLLTMLQQ